MSGGITEEERKLLLSKDSVAPYDDRDLPFLPRSKRSRKKKKTSLWMKKK